MTARNGSAPRLLSRQDILSAQDIVRETVEVPEWGGSVIVQAMDVRRRVVYSEFMFSADGERKRPSLMGDPALVALCCVDEDGEPLFTLSEVEELASKSPIAVRRVAEVAVRLSYPDSRPLVPSAASPSDSPAISE